MAKTIMRSKAISSAVNRVSEEEKGVESPQLQLISSCSTSPVHLTVWCKSLLFNGHGYTVYDSDGEIVFRVENYAHDRRRKSVLMDAAGRVLLTIKRCRKILRMAKIWEAYKGDGDPRVSHIHEHPLLRVTKDVGSPSSVVSVATQRGETPQCYRMRWSRQNGVMQVHRAAATDSSLLVVEVQRKNGASRENSIDKDVLDALIQPEVNQVVVMAMIMIADSMR